MNACKVLLSGLLITSQFISSTSNHGVYYNELKALKKAPATKEMFDEDAHPELSAIQRDLVIYKNLTAFQRFVRSAFLSLDVIIVTPDTLPKLYEYIEDICKKADIAMPTVFLTRHDGFFNAFAQKLLMSSGAIVIGQKLLHDLSDDAIEGVVAHEIGHIKCNHVNKSLALMPISITVLVVLFITFLKKVNVTTVITEEVMDKELGEMITNSVEKPNWLKIGIGFYVSSLLASLIPALIINKRFEEEADEFACKENNKSKGLVEFFKLILQKEELREEEFVAIHQLLQENKTNLTFSDYYGDLMVRYYLAKFGHNCIKLVKHVYYNTFWGAHPSPQARIEAAKKYFQQEA